jgi:hypothetical protein
MLNKVISDSLTGYLLYDTAWSHDPRVIFLLHSSQAYHPSRENLLCTHRE